MIAIIAGVFGFCGIGHIYIGKVLRGVLIMFIGWIPFVIGILVFIAEFISQNEPIIHGLDLSMVVGIVYVAFWIIQALDANRLAKKYNKYLMTKNKPLW